MSWLGVAIGGNFWLRACTVVKRQLRPEFKIPSKIKVAISQLLAIRGWFNYITPIVFKSKTKHQILTNNDQIRPRSDAHFVSFLLFYNITKGQIKP